MFSGIKKLWFGGDRTSYFEKDDTGIKLVDNDFVMKSWGKAPVVVTDAAAYTVLAADSGRVHLVKSIAQDVTCTLPAVAAGLYYEFWFASTAAETENVIFDPTGTANFGGCITHLDTNADNVVVYGNIATEDLLTLVNPGAFRVQFMCDGTDWWLNGHVTSADIPTLA